MGVVKTAKYLLDAKWNYKIIGKSKKKDDLHCKDMCRLL